MPAAGKWRLGRGHGVPLPVVASFAARLPWPSYNIIFVHLQQNFTNEFVTKTDKFIHVHKNMPRLWRADRQPHSAILDIIGQAL